MKTKTNTACIKSTAPSDMKAVHDKAELLMKLTLSANDLAFTIAQRKAEIAGLEAQLNCIRQNYAQEKSGIEGALAVLEPAASVR